MNLTIFPKLPIIRQMITNIVIDKVQTILDFDGFVIINAI